MLIEPAQRLSRALPEPILRLDETVHEASDAARYRWLRDHCTHDNLQELVALVRSARGRLDRQRAIDEAVDQRIAADLLKREIPPA